MGASAGMARPDSECHKTAPTLRGDYAMTGDHTDQIIEVAGTRLQLLKGGSGAPLLLLHGAGGNPGWLPYHQALAQHFTVYAPSHPGYDQSGRPDWIGTINDMAHFYRQF